VKAPSYPVVLRIAGRRCLVVGGGTVAAQKASGLVASGADVVMVAPWFAPESLALDGVRRIERRYRPSDLDGVWLVTTAVDDDAVTAEIAAAAEAAAASEFLARLPQGLDTYVGERGVMLSGGQRQRIAIARAILRDAPILLLDEATSALDAESERLVQGAVDRLAEGRTTLIIAHRLATVKRADRILVFEQGHIVAEGAHGALVAEGGLYARLARLQFTDGAA
jgi:ATP-binding cassette subfamily B protein